MQIVINNKLFISVTLFLFLYTLESIKAQNNYSYNYPKEFINSHVDHIFKDNIKTIVFKQSNKDISYPVLDLNDNTTLILTFDDLESKVNNYQYKIELCTNDWKISEMNQLDYLEGFQINYIHDYETSMNTLIPYTHYSLQIPNKDIQLTKAGNYIIKIFEENEENVVFIRRFMAINKQVTINATVKQATNLEYSNTSQEIDFTIIDDNSLIINPYEDLTITILQNGRWDMANQKLKPKYIKDNELIYDFDTENVFKAGNEFRHFNCKNMRFVSEHIEKIEYQKPYYHVKLQTDEKRIFKQYFSDADLNGNFKIDLENSSYPETEADYVYVYFTLPYETPFLNGYVFAIGNFNAWDKTKNNLMIYNYDKKEYQLRLLLKQGYYNYIYGLLENNKQVIDSEIFEGNHYETENNYIILVYNYNLTLGYDELIGYEVINSMQNN
ncbi:MAG: DUF5103 domain-containing protein [Chlorobi bacterium]|nr:DUF5103 domain-containing protein [Chlorobiota bacterium]